MVLKCLEKEPSRRYPSAEALADDLVAGSAASRSRPDRGPGRAVLAVVPRNPVVAGLTAAVAFVAARGFGRIHILRNSGPRPSTGRTRSASARSNELLLEARHKLIDADVDRGGLLEFAALYRRALDDPYGQDIRWYILTSLAAWSQAEIGGIYPSLRHEEKITAYRLSPDQKSVATACSDGTLSLWEVTSGRLLARRKTLELPVSEVDFSPNGDTLLTVVSKGGNMMRGSDPETVTCRLWRSPSLEPVGEPFPPKAESSFVASDGASERLFSPRGSYIAIRLCHDLGVSDRGRFKRLLTLWDTRTGEKRTQIPLQYEDDRPIVYGFVLWSPDETRIADDRTEAMYDVSSGRLLYKVQSMAGMFPHVSIRGRELAELYTAEKTIRFRNLADGRPVDGVAEIRNESLADANSIEFSPTGRLLTTNKNAGYSPDSESWVHQGLFRREDGRRVLSLAHDRVSIWVDNDRFVITKHGYIYDTETGERVKPEPGRAYPLMVETIGGGRLVPGPGRRRPFRRCALGRVSA